MLGKDTIEYIIGLVANGTITQQVANGLLGANTQPEQVKPEQVKPQPQQQSDNGAIEVYGQHAQDGLVLVGVVPTRTVNHRAKDGTVTKITVPNFNGVTRHKLMIDNAQNMLALTEQERNAFAIARKASGDPYVGSSGNAFYWADGSRYPTNKTGSRFARKNNLGHPFERDAQRKLDAYLSNMAAVDNAKPKAKPSKVASKPASTAVHVDLPAFMVMADNGNVEPEQPKKLAGSSLWLSEPNAELFSADMAAYGFETLEQQHEQAKAAKAYAQEHNISIAGTGWHKMKYGDFCKMVANAMQQAN